MLPYSGTTSGIPAGRIRLWFLSFVCFCYYLFIFFIFISVIWEERSDSIIKVQQCFPFQSPFSRHSKLHMHRQSDLEIALLSQSW